MEIVSTKLDDFSARAVNISRAVRDSEMEGPDLHVVIGGDGRVETWTKNREWAKVLFKSIAFDDDDSHVRWVEPDGLVHSVDGLGPADRV